MVHHASTDEIPRRSLIPQSLLARAAIATAAAVVLTLAVGAVALAGGLESADATPAPSPPGEEMRNKLFAFTPHEARLVTDEYGFEIHVLADVEVHGVNEPVSVQTVGSTMVARVLPGGQEIKFPSAGAVRYTGSQTFDYQPHMRDETSLSWSVTDNPFLDDLFTEEELAEGGDAELFGPKDEATEEGVTAEDVEGIEISLHEAEMIHTRDGQELWVDTPVVVGVVELPVERI
ncbi:hypothetical protein DFP74_2108 [Nocardiopsis sp. Huas11]|uniref:hypothetical protein n=1 Tax=Nocardiopsis sp. Huas11 TaxID=2183912 RepID=UPI000EABEBC1|nr:hypothetical protein [Nocardiopsis sp. Huas11]RKS06476.1 hypothetical protein DFP74_2108 [Nocardiopsis sp. Huas11]